MNNNFDRARGGEFVEPFGELSIDAILIVGDDDPSPNIASIIPLPVRLDVTIKHEDGPEADNSANA